jgi:hypothetical protein
MISGFAFGRLTKPATTGAEMRRLRRRQPRKTAALSNQRAGESHSFT